MKRTYKIESRISVISDIEGQSIEQKMRKVTQSKEPIENVAPLIYTERKDGVLPQYDVRTDRWKIAQDTMDRIYASKAAARDKAAKQVAKAVAEDLKKEVQQQQQQQQQEPPKTN